MGQLVWARQKSSKFFYVGLYRLGLSLAIYSMLLNIGLILLLWFVHLHQPSRAYYATNGVMPPVELTPLWQPNESSTPLLPSSPVEREEVKLIPD